MSKPGDLVADGWSLCGRGCGSCRCSRTPDRARCCPSTRRCRAARSPGTSCTASTHQPAETTSAASAASRCSRRLAPRRRREQQVGDGEAGQHEEALQHLGEKRGAHGDADQHQPAPRRRRRPHASRSRRPTVSNSTSSASGLLKRNISAAAGVHASTAPASRPAADPVAGVGERPAHRRSTAPPRTRRPSAPGGPAPTSCSCRTGGRTVRSPTARRAACRR